MSNTTMIGSKATMDSLVAVVVAKGGINSAVLSKFLSSVYTQDGSLTLAAKKAEHLGNASDFVASALSTAQNAVTTVENKPASTSATPFMATIAQPGAGHRVASQVAAAAA